MPDSVSEDMLFFFSHKYEKETFLFMNYESQTKLLASSGVVPYRFMWGPHSELGSPKCGEKNFQWRSNRIRCPDATCAHRRSFTCHVLPRAATRWRELQVGLWRNGAFGNLGCAQVTSCAGTILSKRFGPVLRSTPRQDCEKKRSTARQESIQYSQVIGFKDASTFCKVLRN